MFFDTLPAGARAVRSAFIGKVGLALSGGGFRASFYHLGVLAFLAERDVLRHIDVLSCVSGGSIVGACYWLALRKRLIEQAPLTRFVYPDGQGPDRALSGGRRFRSSAQHSAFGVAVAYRVLVKGQQGALDPEEVAVALERDFYRPLMPGRAHFTCTNLRWCRRPDHDPPRPLDAIFNPIRDNWLRHDKVPALVVNATALNTGHAWQFTPPGWVSRRGPYTTCATRCPGFSGHVMTARRDGRSRSVARLPRRHVYRACLRRLNSTRHMKPIDSVLWTAVSTTTGDGLAPRTELQRTDCQ